MGRSRADLLDCAGDERRAIMPWWMVVAEIASYGAGRVIRWWVENNEHRKAAAVYEQCAKEADR